jgi:hypothetical protein
MKILNFLLSISIIALLPSCIKSSEDNSTKPEPTSVVAALSKVTQKVDGNISIVSGNLEYSEFPAQIDIEGFFHNSDGNNVKIEELIIGNYSIKEQSNGFYYKNFSSLKEDEKLAKDKLTAKNVSISLTSNALGNFNSEIYSPQFVKSKINNLVNGEIIKNNGLVISWIPDSKGSQLAVVVSYEGKAYPNRGTSLPQELITSYKLVDENTGSVKFTPEELAKFPINGSLRFSVGRATQKVFTTTTNKKVAVTCLSHCFSADYELK